MVSSKKEKKILHMEQTLSGINMKPYKKRKIIWKEIILEQPTVPVSGDLRYLTFLWVSANVDNPRQSDSSQFGSELQLDSLYHQDAIKSRIREALKRLSFREQHVLVQFWSPHQVGKHQLLTTNDQPFGVGVVSEELCFYRRDSERNSFLVDKDHEEEDISPPARVFRRGMPEWTSDLSNYNTKDFPQQECAIRCNLHGYLALPVFDSTTGLCVGVLELLTSVKYTSYAFEVQQVHKALKVENLSSPKVFNSNIPKVLCERRKRNKIDSLTMEALNQHIIKPLDQTAQSLEGFMKFENHGVQRMNNVNDSKEEVSDNFTIQKNNLLKQVGKRKRDSDLVPSTTELIVYVTFNKSMERFTFPLSHGLANLKNKVTKRFELDGEKLLLKYVDEDGDLILICPEDDLRSALDASGCMKLICCLED